MRSIYPLWCAFWFVVLGLASATRLVASPPPNDAFANATTLSGSVVSATGTNVGATRESGEPYIFSSFYGGASVWWRWTAPTSGPITIDTNGSNFDTLLAIYTGSSVSALSLIAEDDDTGSSLTSSITFSAVAGTVYRIVVDGYTYSEIGFPEVGSIVLNIGGTATAPAIAVPPRDLELLEGTQAVFTVSAVGSGPLSYAWQRLVFQGSSWTSLAGEPGYSGVTTATLTIPSVTLNRSGNQYRCVVSNNVGSITSAAAYLLVEPANVVPSISTPPADRSVPAGQSAGFTVSAAGSPPLSYRWQRMAAGTTAWANLSDTSTYNGSTSASLSVLNTVTSMNGDRFRCIVTNPAGSVTSAAALLTVSPPNQPPSFSVQPSSVSANAGASASFSVVVSGNPAPTIQWESARDATAPFLAVSGGTGASLTISPLLLSQNGQRYRAVATNAAGSATSSVVTLTVIEVIFPTTITLQPLGGTFRLGESTTLTVAAEGSGPFQYAWFRDGRPLAGATGPSLVLNNLAAASAGGYHVVVTGRGGTAASRSASVSVQQPPLFTVQPVDVSVQVGLNAAFRAVATGDPAPNLQWFSRTGNGPWSPVAEGGQFRGTTSTLLSISGVLANQNGLQFQARATNTVGTLESNAVTLQARPVSSTLRILGQPQSVLVRAGQPAQFTVSMEGSGPFSFQWSQNGVTRVGATTSVCNLATTNANSAGGFSVVVTDATGASITSNVAYLTVAGAVDSRFDPRGGPDGEITEMLTLSTGGYLVAGSFSRFAGVPSNGLARLRKDGTVDPNFNVGTGPNGVVRGLLELAEEKCLVIGQFDRFNGEVVPGVVRLDSKGRLDPTFNADLPLPFIGRESEIPALERFQYAVIALRGGGYLLGGKLGLVALTTSGATRVQTVFRTTGAVYALLEQYDGGILAAGDFTLMSGFVRPRMARLTPDFRMDLAFDVGTGPNSTVRTLLRSPDGAVYVMGNFTAFNGQPRPSGIARIGPRGQLDIAYNPAIAPVTVANEGSAISSSGSVPAAGRLDAIRAGQVRPDGGLVVSSGVTTAQNVVAVTPAGAVSAVEDVVVQGAANALTLNDDEGVAVGGQFSAIAGTSISNVGVVTDASSVSRLTNLSCRARVSPSTGVLILGFVIQGPDAMRVLVRGVGPTLSVFGINDAVSRPQLTLFNSAGQVVRENVGWQSDGNAATLAQAMRQVGAFDLSSVDDTAILINLPPGAYTAHIGGRNGAQGVALGEIYAVDVGRSRLINSAVRGPVGSTPENFLIPGFTVSGGSRLMLVRALGPGLAQFGVPGTLARPKMDLKSSNGSLIATNTGWTNGFDPAALQVRALNAGAFALSTTHADSAVVTPLSAGGFTVTISGADGGTGAVLVEIYDANGIERTAPTQ